MSQIYDRKINDRKKDFKVGKLFHQDKISENIQNSQFIHLKSI